MYITEISKIIGKKYNIRGSRGGEPEENSMAPAPSLFELMTPAPAPSFFERMAPNFFRLF